MFIAPRTVLSRASVVGLVTTMIVSGAIIVGAAPALAVSTTTALSIERVDPSPAMAGAELRWAVTIDEPVIGLDATDFVITTTGVAGATFLSSVPQNGGTYDSVWIVTVLSDTGGGTVRLDLSATAAVDNSGVLFNTPLAGEAYVIDPTGLTVSQIPTQTQVRAGETVTYIVTVTSSSGDTSDVAVDSSVDDCARTSLGTVSEGSPVTYSCTGVAGIADFTTSITAAGTGSFGRALTATGGADVTIIAPSELAETGADPIPAMLFGALTLLAGALLLSSDRRLRIAARTLRA